MKLLSETSMKTMIKPGMKTNSGSKRHIESKQDIGKPRDKLGMKATMRLQARQAHKE